MLPLRRLIACGGGSRGSTRALRWNLNHEIMDDGTGWVSIQDLLCTGRRFCFDVVVWAFGVPEALAE